MRVLPATADVMSTLSSASVPITMSASMCDWPAGAGGALRFLPPEVSAGNSAMTDNRLDVSDRRTRATTGARRKRRCAQPKSKMVLFLSVVILAIDLPQGLPERV